MKGAINTQIIAMRELVSNYWLYDLWKNSSLSYERRLAIKQKTVALISSDRIMKPLS